MHPIVSAALILLAGTLAASAQPATPPKGNSVTITPAIVKDLAPTGTLRASINYGNIVLAHRAADGALSGVTVELARELGKRLNVPVELHPFDTAGKAFEAVKAGKLDVIFLAIEPVRAAEIAFTPPYVVIEGTYMVTKDSPLKAVADVDKAGAKVAVGKGSAYDLYLTRTIKSAELVRAPTSAEAIDLFAKDKLDAVAGVKQPLVIYAKAHPEMRVMDGRFQVIEQAMGTPRGRDAGAAYLKSFIEEMKASGFVADALKRNNQPDAVVAPPAG